MLVGVGCSQATSFVCTTDSECASDTGAGFCEADGFCSFFDPDCESERRYGQLAGGGLAGTCVPTGGTGGAGSTDSTGDGPTSDTTGADEGSSGSADDGTTLAVGSTGDTPAGATTVEATSVGSSGTSESSSDESSSGSTGVTNVCPLVDDFEDGLLDDAWFSFDADEVTEQDGALQLFMEPPAGGYPGIGFGEIDLSNALITAEVGEVPDAYGAQSMFVLYYVPGQTGFSFMIQFDHMSLRQFTADQFTDMAVFPWDPDMFRWLRFREVDGLLAFDVSPDGVSFEEFFSVPLDDLGNWEVNLAATDWANLDAPMTVSFTHFEYCVE